MSLIDNYTDAFGDIQDGLTDIAYLLEDAVEKQDWSFVNDAYQKITGHAALEIPEQEPSNDEALKAVIKRLERLEEEKPKNSRMNKKTPVKKKRGRPKKKAVKKKVEPTEEDFTVSHSKRTRRKKAGEGPRANLFEDLVDDRVLKESEKEPGFDKIDDSIPPSKRSRAEYKPVKVTCTQCGTKEEVHPTFYREEYVCDTCVARKSKK